MEYNKILSHLFLNNNGDSVKMLFVAVYSYHYQAVSTIWHSSSIFIHFELVVALLVLLVSLIYLTGHSMAHAG